MAEVREGQVFGQNVGGSGDKAQWCQGGRYGTQREPFYLTLRRSGSLEEAASSSNPEESGKERQLRSRSKALPIVQ